MKYYTLFIITFILINPIFNCILFSLGIHSASGQLQIAYITMFMATLFFFIKNFSKNLRETRLTLTIVIIISLLFFATQIFYNTENTMYISELLCWGASSLPAALCGAMYSRKPLNDLHKKLPYFIIPLTFIISYVSYTTSGRTSADRISDDTTGLNYQSISYYMAQLFGLTTFCLLIYDGHKKEILNKLILYILLIIQFVTCFSSGGRGGLVLLIFYFLYYIYKKVSLQKINLTSLVGIFLSLVIFLIIIEQFGLFNTVGYSRLLDTFHEGDANRSILRNMALDSFYNSPILGHGTGSIFFEIGTYSHNFLIDILVENGIIGLLIIICFLLYCFIFLKKTKKNYSSIFITIVFIHALTLNTFSGYWLANHILWFVFGYILSIRKNQLPNKNFIYG